MKNKLQWGISVKMTSVYWHRISSHIRENFFLGLYKLRSHLFMLKIILYSLVPNASFVSVQHLDQAHFSTDFEEIEAATLWFQDRLSTKLRHSFNSWASLQILWFDSILHFRQTTLKLLFKDKNVTEYTEVLNTTWIQLDEVVKMLRKIINQNQ